MRITFAGTVAGVGAGTTERVLLFAADPAAELLLKEAGGVGVVCYLFPSNERRKLLKLIEQANDSRSARPSGKETNPSKGKVRARARSKTAKTGI